MKFEVESEIALMQARHSRWMQAMSRVASGAQVFVTARMRDAPMIVDDHLEREMHQEFSSVEMNRIIDILNNFPDPHSVTNFLRACD